MNWYKNSTHGILQNWVLTHNFLTPGWNDNMLTKDYKGIALGREYYYDCDTQDSHSSTQELII